jgi:hypothetical protein
MFFDLVCLAMVCWVSFRVSDEGAWGAAMVFFTVLFSGLIAMNTFEPLAEWLAIQVSDSETWQSRWDVISLLGLFGASVFIMRVVTERLAPARMPIPQLAEFPLRWLAAIATASVTLGVLLTSLHIAPLPRVVTKDEILEVAGFQPEREQFFGLAPDRQWLEFNQWLSQQALNRGDSSRLFDGPIYRSGGQSGRWPSFPIRYADRRERLTRSRLGLDP